MSELGKEIALEIMNLMEEKIKNDDKTTVEKIKSMFYSIPLRFEKYQEPSAGMFKDTQDVFNKNHAHDPISRPAHYTSGNIECIDAISDAVSGLKGKEAYNTGAAIKPHWLW